jgi:formylmethanofuran dehydrogenase subunit D
MPQTFILIPGRTSRQGCGISEGKFGPSYQEETQTLLMCPEDMQELGLNAGDRVRLSSDAGQAEVKVAPAKAGELPRGLLFIAYGDASSRLMGADTHGSGMPTSKGLDVTIEKLAAPMPPAPPSQAAARASNQTPRPPERAADDESD